MANLPAVVTILDLPLATTLSSAALFEAVQTTAGVVESVRVSLPQIVTVALGTTAGLSVLGVAGVASAVISPIVGVSGGQVLRLNDAGTELAFGAVNLGSSAAVTGVLPSGNITAINLATTGAGGVQGVLPVSQGGTNTSTLTPFGLLYGNGTSTVGITAAGTTGWPLVGRGAASAVFTSTLPGIGMVAPWQGGYVTGRYYHGIAGQIFVSNLSTDIAYFWPIVIGETHTFDRLGVDLGTMGSATTMRIALYGVSNGIASSLLVDAGTVALATGFISAVISQSLTAGVYWAGVVFNGTCSVAVLNALQAGVGAYTGFGTSFITGTLQVNASLTFGAFPGTAFTSTMGAARYSNSFVPMIGVRA